MSRGQKGLGAGFRAYTDQLNPLCVASWKKSPQGVVNGQIASGVAQITDYGADFLPIFRNLQFSRMAARL